MADRGTAMYLSLLSIKNFRCFDEKDHIITFKKGLTVLVGENDSGKSAIMDAIKMVLGTTDIMQQELCSCLQLRVSVYLYLDLNKE